MKQLSNDAAPRSGFVTRLAWTSIALAGFATLIALVQNIIFSLTSPLAEMREMMRTADSQPMPAFARFMFDNLRLIFVSFLVLSALTLVSAIGLLKRKNWARLVFIGVMVLGVLWNLGAIAAPFFLFFSSFSPVFDHMPADFRDRFDLIWKAMTAFTLMIAVAVAALFAWIIKRLVSHEIGQEFLAH